MISIITPIYNRASLIPIMIQGVVQQQTFTQWELILVDEGSNDHTKTIVEGFYDPRIKYLYKKNKDEANCKKCKNHWYRFFCSGYYLYK